MAPTTPTSLSAKDGTTPSPAIVADIGQSTTTGCSSEIVDWLLVLLTLPSITSCSLPACLRATIADARPSNRTYQYTCLPYCPSRRYLVLVLLVEQRCTCRGVGPGRNQYFAAFWGYLGATLMAADSCRHSCALTAMLPLCAKVALGSICLCPLNLAMETCLFACGFHGGFKGSLTSQEKYGKRG